MRVKRGTKARKRRKKLLKLASGFRGRSGNTIRQARSRLDKSLCYAYRDRRAKKRDFRGLWITRINAAVRSLEINLSYSQLINGLKQANIEIDRKVLADLGVFNPEAFAAVAGIAKSSLSK